MTSPKSAYDQLSTQDKCLVDQDLAFVKGMYRPNGTINPDGLKPGTEEWQQAREDLLKYNPEILETARKAAQSPSSQAMKNTFGICLSSGFDEHDSKPPRFGQPLGMQRIIGWEI